MIASLSAAIAYQMPEALQKEMRQRELERMRVHELESFIAQRYFVANLQTHPNAGLRTWQSAYRALWNVLADIRHSITRAMAHLRWERVSDAEVILARLELEADIGSDDDEPTSDSDEEDEDDMV